ncbi:SWIM zinc finger family protein [Nonomuraea sp. B19D2]|uniref:SWIM zinc finger family protein n=1 Tax=Nonomuraea sp. B19D2 TaxID=3159561 RepID=UPI0032DAA585
MTSATQAYTYAAPSSLVDGRLGLATSGERALSGPAVAPRFFSGVVTQAAPAAAGLLGVADVALARYHQPQARPGWVRDPVVTCNGDRLRFESFSACGGVYARLDLLNRTLDGEVFDRGTTNVDVNAPLREALARVGARDPLHLGVGLDELVVTTMDGAVVEKKVPLPERWLRGFAGEGAVLGDLATDEAENDADVVGMLLNFEPEVEIGLLADRAGIPADRVRAALTQLGVAGRVGYDLSEAAHFHRELPYDKDNVILLNPRLAKARKLVDAGAVHLEGELATVHTSGGARRVSLADGPCTCEWWWDHRGSRGPCKHVLAARIVARAAVEVSR